MNKNIEADDLQRRARKLLATFDEPVVKIATDRGTAEPTATEHAAIEALRVLANTVVCRAWGQTNALSYKNDFSLLGNRFAAFTQEIERQATHHLLLMAADQNQRDVATLAENLKRLVTDLASREARLWRALSNPSDRLQEHLDIVRAARERYPFDGDTTGNATACALLGHIANKKSAQIGATPRLILIHDFDNSLTTDFAEYSNEIPLRNMTTLSRRALDFGDLTRARIRMSLLAGIMNLSGLKEGLEKQLRRCTAHVNIFHDAIDILTWRAPGVSHFVLSANFERYVSAALAAHVPNPPGVIALSSDSYLGPEKVVTVLETVVANPTAVVVVIDDGDHRLINAISGPIRLNGLTLPYSLHDFVHLCARHEAERPQLFPLKVVLDSNRVVSGTNVSEVNGRRRFGYQGVSSLRLSGRW